MATESNAELEVRIERLEAELDGFRSLTTDQDAEIGRLTIYERACDSMAAQFVDPKMTGLELAQKQMEGGA